jgi:carbon-monoxide dehydrogenase large subunit
MPSVTLGAPAATRSGIGDAPNRREDLRFLTGQGSYLDDLSFDGLTHAVVLRSPHAHARIERVDVAAASTMPGVLAVLTAAQASADGLKPLLPYVETNTQTGERFAFAPQPLLAEAIVRYAGEPVVLIVAETHSQGLDAAERVRVDYRPLPSVTTAAAARAPGAPELSPEVPGNLCFEWLTGDGEAVEAAFAAAAHVVRLALDNHRVVTNPIEPRGGIGLYDPASGRYTLHVSGQSIHATRDKAHVRSASRRRRCALSRPMSAAGLARKTSSTPSMY